MAELKTPRVPLCLRLRGSAKVIIRNFEGRAAVFLPVLDEAATDVCVGASVFCRTAIPSDCWTHNSTLATDGLESMLKNPSAFLPMSSRLCFDAARLVCSLIDIG